MCGIFGLIRYNQESIPLDLITRMQESISHRGPDHRGIYTEPGLALGINRLAIIDLVTGNQPIFNEDRSLVIVYNGQIYNHRDIREALIRRGHTFYSRSDTEVVIHAFEEFGERCLDKFNGMFAFAIWDVRQKKLFVARDRLGIKPLYISNTREGFAFASEAKALLKVLTSAAPDWTAISRYFSFGYVPFPQSAFEGISKLPAGNFGILHERKWQTETFWAPCYGLGHYEKLDMACNRVEELMEHAVELELMSDVPVGIFLSGGLDSSAVALFAKRRSQEKMSSFTLRFEEETHDESHDARIVADYLDLNHTEVCYSREVLRQSLFDVAEVLDEPFGDSTVLPLLVLSRCVRKQVKVVLTGWGGDEIFAGYPTYRAHQLASYYRNLPRVFSQTLVPALVNRLPVSSAYMSFEFKAKRFIKGIDLSPELQHFLWMGYYDEAAKNRLFHPAILDHIQEATYAEVKKLIETIPEQDLVSRIMHLDACYFLEGNGLFQADRMAMAASLEARVPLLNIDLVEYVSALPISLKMCGNIPKGLMKKVMGKYLPPQIINKPKKGFGPPSAVWVKGVFAGVFDDIFSKERVESQGIFNYDEIARLRDEHQHRRIDHGRHLWALLNFQLWYNNFIGRGV